MISRSAFVFCIGALLLSFSTSHSWAQRAPWVKVKPAFVIKLLALSPDTLLYIQFDNHYDYSLWTSTDSGASWDSSQVFYCPKAHPGGFLPNDIAALSVNDVYLGGFVDTVRGGDQYYSAIRHTTDRGKTWNDFLTFPKSPTPYGNWYGLKLLRSGEMLYSAGSGPSGMDSIYILNTDGARHTVFGSNHNGAEFFDFRDGQTGMVILSSNAGLVRTVDGGATWDTVANPFYPTGISYLNGSTWLAVQQDSIYTSTDDGASWNVTLHTPTTGWSVFSSHGYGFVLGGPDLFFGSWDGSNWQQLTAPDSTSGDIIAAASPQVIYCAAPFEIYRSNVIGQLGVAAATQEVQQALSIVPNPAPGIVKIAFAPSGNPRTLSAFDILGRKVASVIVQAGARDIELDLTGLNSAIYTIELGGAHQQLAIER